MSEWVRVNRNENRNDWCFYLLSFVRFRYNASPSIRYYWLDCTRLPPCIWRDVTSLSRHRKKLNYIWTISIRRRKMCPHVSGDVSHRPVHIDVRPPKLIWSTSNCGKWPSTYLNGTTTRYVSPWRENCSAHNRPTITGRNTIVPLNWLQLMLCSSQMAR